MTTAAAPVDSAAHLDHLIAGILPDITAIRHDLHMHPEIAFAENRTSAIIQRELTALGIAFKSGLARGTGVVAHLPATDAAGAQRPTIGLRADIDALPITELTGLSYASKNPGFMHACGHDGHTAMLLGAARVLSAIPRPRPVTLVFQPAEEGGGGGQLLCNEGLMRGEIIGGPISAMFGLHGWPELPVGTIGTRAGPLLAATDEVHIIIHGTQSHAAYPQYANDTVLCLCQCITALQQIVSRNVGPLESAVLSMCILKAGTARNVLPSTAEAVGTLRTLDAKVRELATARITAICEGTAAAFGCRAEVCIECGYPVTYNNPQLTEKWFAAMESTFGSANITRLANPVMGGEDFSYYAREAPSVFFCLGVRPPGQLRYPTLHQPEFDFNDAALPVGIKAMVTAATSLSLSA